MTTPQPSLEDLEELRALTSALRAEAVAELGAVSAELAAIAVEQRAERDAVMEQFAEKARAGELGDEQRRLQERMDLGQTSWGALADGSDDSPDAVAVRVQVERGAERAVTELEEYYSAERAAGRPDPRQELADTFTELRVLVAGLAATLGTPQPGGAPHGTAGEDGDGRQA